jgi:DNA-binding PadR family transcriptional regulator
MNPESEDTTAQNWMKEVQKGYIRMGILILLSRKPSHGYEIMKEINNRTKGFWQPTPGGVYPILRDLEKSSYIKGQWEKQKNRNLKVYKITQSGEAILKRAIVKQSQILNNISSLFNEFARDVLNVQTDTTPLPNMPSPLSPFLEENKSYEENLKQMEHERKHTIEGIKSMKARLKQINLRISEVKRTNQETSGN